MSTIEQTAAAKDWQQEAAERKAAIAAKLAELKLTIDPAFVPLSRSRNAKEKHKTLNWRIAVQHDGRTMFTTDYSAGSGHCPSYTDPAYGRPRFMSVDRDKAITWECENGKRYSFHGATKGEPILPDVVDVFYSLVSDSNAIDYANFETWADELGFDTDSRKAEAAYRSCLECALALRSAIGDAALQELRQLFQDY